MSLAPSPAAPRAASGTLRAAYGAASTLAGIALGFLIGVLGITGAALVVLLIAAPVLFVVRWTWLPALALCAFALFPVKYFPFPGPYGVVSGGTFVVLLWMSRTNVLAAWEAGGRQPPSRRLRRGLVACAAWVLFICALTPLSVSSVGWTGNFILLALVPPLLTFGRTAAQPIIAAVWMGLGAVLGLYAVMERFLLYENPLYDWAYHSSLVPLQQIWSVYRSTTTLGHPLNNGLFFAIATSLALSEWLRSRRATVGACGVLAAAGVLVTASRGALVAVLAGGLAIAVSNWKSTADTPGHSFSRRHPVVAGLAALVILAGFSFAALEYLEVRNTSEEGAGSAAYREETLLISEQLVRASPIFGAGPGQADATKKALGGEYTKIGIENSWAQIAVSLGFPGLLLMLYLLYAGARSSFSSSVPGATGALVAYGVGAASFNLIEADYPALLMLGLLLALCVATPKADSQTAEAGPRPPARPPRKRTG